MFSLKYRSRCFLFLFFPRHWSFVCFYIKQPRQRRKDKKLQVSNLGGLMRRSKVVVIALKRLSVLLTGSPAALWSLLLPQHRLLPVSQHASCNHTLVLSPFSDYFSSWDLFRFLHPEQSQLCRKKARVHKFHILPQPVQFAITRFEAGAPPACMPSSFPFLSLKFFLSL